MKKLLRKVLLHYVNYHLYYVRFFFYFSGSTDFQEEDVLGFFESLEQEKVQAEMAKMIQKQKSCPVAPDCKT